MTNELPPLPFEPKTCASLENHPQHDWYDSISDQTYLCDGAGHQIVSIEDLQNNAYAFLVPGGEVQSAIGETYLSIPRQNLTRKIVEYVQELEIGQTAEWCKCEWHVHPADSHLNPDTCATCGISKEQHQEYRFKELDHEFTPPRIRKRKGETSMDCPVHTREGFILGFFNWLFEDKIK